MRLSGTSGWSQIDSSVDRSLFWSDYEERFDLLCQAVAEGKLDDALNRPELMIHGIMGLGGELLGILGVDPKLSKTYITMMQLAEKTDKKQEFSHSPTTISFTNEVKKIQNSLDIIHASTRKKPNSFGTAKAFDLGYFVPIGIYVVDLSIKILENMNLPTDTRGVLVTQVEADSVADKAGIRGGEQRELQDWRGFLGGDVVIGVDMQPTPTATVLKELLASPNLGRICVLHIIRDGKHNDVSVSMREP